ncbi:MAG TPA: DUF2085 domain-containing protein [Verrucomicrobiae bacterium]|nr:DUF2085 domain-containing protein [Verrucomicrobiae bacterium]
MHQLLFSIFSTVCGENPDHLWAPGGEVLPCCQRCTGLYVGALIAMGLHFRFKPRASVRWFQIHALFLLQLGLFIFPWIPQSPVLRTVSGTLFGFGTVAFLWAAVLVWCPPFKASAFTTLSYLFGLASCLVLTPIITKWGGKPGAFVLTAMLLAGAVSLAALAAANLFYLLQYFVEEFNAKRA